MRDAVVNKEGISLALGADFRLHFLLPGVAVLVSLHLVFKKGRTLYCDIKSTNSCNIMTEMYFPSRKYREND